MNDNSFGSAVRRDILFYLILAVFALFSIRLFKMQILDNSIYEEKSAENSIKGMPIRAPRGVLYDRNFDYLVSNKPSYTIEVIPDEYNKSSNLFLEKVLQVDSSYINSVFDKYKSNPPYTPRKLRENVSIRNIAWVEENKDTYTGIHYYLEMQRDYSFNVNGSHMFGYVREIDSKQLQQKKDEYDIGDFIGYSGIEKAYEQYLRGRKGFEYYVFDSKQRKIGKYNEGKSDVIPLKGYDLLLTIDRDVQIKAEELFQGLSGAVVAIEPSTGEILAFVSAPEFNLADLSSMNSSDVWKNLTQDEQKPLFNRATMSSNPPGSTFKMITALAALEKGVITTANTVTCGGGYQFGNRFFKCTHVHGTVNVVSAIERSCNTFFYQLILKIGLDNWASYGNMFGFGEKTGIDIGEESKGIMPDSEYFDKAYGKGKWTNGYLISLAIGQGDIISTPVQLAKYASLLATSGHSYQPHFVKGYINWDNNYVPLAFPKIDLNISQKNFDIVREGMFRVVNGAGTAGNIRIPEYSICGKTGTAQNPHGKDHALFIAFAPYENPKIAVSVIVENVGFGSTHAAPVAKELIKTYLDKLNHKSGDSVVQNKENDIKDENKL